MRRDLGRIKGTWELTKFLPYSLLSARQREEADTIAALGGDPADGFTYQIEVDRIRSRVSIVDNPPRRCGRCGKDLAGQAVEMLEHDRSLDVWRDGGVAPEMSGGARPFDLGCAGLLLQIAGERIEAEVMAELNDLVAQRPGFADIEIIA